MNSPYFERGWRLGVGIVLLNIKKEIFMGERLDNKGAWQMPQGGVKIGKNEELDAAAIRELYEETGVTSVKLISKSTEWYYYELPKPIASKLWGGKFVGQKQKWFLFHFLGQNSEINIKNNSSPEFHDWKWVKPIHVSNEIVNFKKDIYNKVLIEFGIL